MRILFISPHLSTGGLPQFLLKKIQVLSRDHDVWCVEYANHGGFTVQRNQISDLLGKKFLELGQFKEELLYIIKEVKPDVIHLEEMPEYFMEMKIALKFYNKDNFIVETSHDSSFDWRNKKVLPDKFILVSEFQKKMLEPLGVPMEVCEYPIVINPVGDKEAAKKALGFDLSNKHVINVGLFTPRKNQAEIIEYARSLLNQPVQFHFIGNQADNFKSYWEPLMKDFPQNCTWWNERKDVDSFYKAADLFLFTSRGSENNKETNPLVIREAVSYNIPSLIYNLPVYLGMYDKYSNISYLNFDNLSYNRSLILEKLGLQESKKKTAFVVSTYPKDQATAETTKKCLEALNKFGLPVILASHCDVPESVSEFSDHIIVDKKSNILTKHDFYCSFWGHIFSEGQEYRVDLSIRNTDNHTYHGPAVYTNYYNAIKMASYLGYESVICLNFDFILNDKAFLDKILSKMNHNSAYFIEEKAAEGMTFKTVIHAIDCGFFEKLFNKISAEADYNAWKTSVGSESNGLENIYWHTLKSQSCVYKSTMDEYAKDVSNCEIDSNSQVEYFAVLPVEENDSKIAILFQSSNTIDDRNLIIKYPNGSIEENIDRRSSILKIIDLPKDEFSVELEMWDRCRDKILYSRKIECTKDYLVNKLPSNGKVKKL